MVFATLKAGLTALMRNKRMLFTFYAVNLLFGLLIMLPFRGLISNFIGTSHYGEILGGNFDMNFFFDLIREEGTALGMLPILFLAGVLIYSVFNIFLSGGAFAIFANENQDYDTKEFWGNCGKYFGPFLRLAAASLVILIPLAIVVGLTQVLLNSLTEDAYQYFGYWASWFSTGLRYIAMVFFFAVFDYARIHRVLTDQSSLRTGLSFALSNFRRVMTLSFTYILIGVVVLLIYNPISDLLSMPTWFIILSLLVLQQLYMMFRMALRLGLYASEVTLYKELGNFSAEEMITTLDAVDFD